jgi:hypothetical protein
MYLVHQARIKHQASRGHCDDALVFARKSPFSAYSKAAEEAALEYQGEKASCKLKREYTPGHLLI